MSGEGALFTAEGWERPAREFVPASHRGLPMLRLFLPFVAPDDGTVRWSRYVDIAQQPASLSWWEVADRVADAHPGVRDLISCMGVLDAPTAAALRDAVGSLPMRRLRWKGYRVTPGPADTRRVHGNDFFEDDLDPADLCAEARVPEFAWDADGRLAWGARLYPDSLIVAADPSLFRRLHEDARLDTATVRPDRDTVPPSAGD